MRLARRDVLASLGAIFLGSATKAFGTTDNKQGIILNDASGFEATPMARHVLPLSKDYSALTAELRAEVARAAAENRALVASAARHSMGGQSLIADGVAITMDPDFPPLMIDPDDQTYSVMAGTSWRTVISALDREDWSPAVMQSNNDFGIGASFSVNAHGWAVPFGPCGATVRAVQILRHDGRLTTASRTENPEIFALVMGGYGLAGLIISLHLEMVPNIPLQPELKVLPTADFASAFVETVRQPNIRMAYGRLSIARDGFLEEALIKSFVALDGRLPSTISILLPQSWRAKSIAPSKAMKKRNRIAGRLKKLWTAFSARPESQGILFSINPFPPSPLWTRAAWIFCTNISFRRIASTISSLCVAM